MKRKSATLFNPAPPTFWDTPPRPPVENPAASAPPAAPDASEVAGDTLAHFSMQGRPPLHSRGRPSPFPLASAGTTPVNCGHAPTTSTQTTQKNQPSAIDQGEPTTPAGRKQ